MPAAQWVCLAVLLAVASTIVVRCLSVGGGILHLPFLATVALMGFLGPQAVGVIRTEEAPWYAVCKFLLFSAACIVALSSGWATPPASDPASAPASVAQQLRMFFWLGLCLEVVGLVGLWKLAGLVGGFRNLYLEAAGYSLEWRGAPVIYTFFAHYLTPGGILVALAALRLRSLGMLTLALPWFGADLAAVVLVARRTPLVILCVVSVCLLYLTRRYLPPRWVLGLLGVVVLTAMFALPAYRRAGGVFSSAPPSGGGSSVREALAAGGTEFRDGCYLIQVTEEERAFHYGVGFYNSLVRYFVPRRLVGDEMKERLLVDLPDAGHVGPRASEVPNRYGWRIDPSTVPTGPASVFQQFWYAGCLCFYVLARWLRRHWDGALRGDLRSQAVYAISVTFAVAAVVNNIYAIYIPVFMFVVPLALVTQFSPWRRHGVTRLFRRRHMGLPHRFFPRERRGAC